MAARITEVRRKKILADYLETENYRETGRRNGVSDVTVRKLVMENSDFKRAIEAKKEQDEADIIAYMDSKRDKVCKIIALGLDALADPEKLKGATPAQITTALGTLIDKWLLLKNPQSGGTAKIEIKTDDPELARWLNGN
ncbi:MAG: helix-turn-helix domain-containing protein [Christensenellaceae bacterium]|nr:helix-turn-helix domain-containing protein [Christensenellaceae bacterium]